ncbi:MAG: nuclear transport factor 2 family protein [candidate division Zixibacteria bacterium]|nr:nuclear transport factor 2 family protein [candidate division Zixibacteria bacterium]
MKLFGPLIGLIAMAALMFCCSQATVDTVDIEKEKADLIQTDKDFSATSVEKGAAEAFRMYLTEDAVQLPTRSHPVMGRDAIYDNMSANSGNYTLAWEPAAVEVAKSGDLAYTWGMYSLTYQDSTGEEKVSPGKYLNIWKKQADGTWKVAIDMGN